ncbi:MAG: sugar phosphate nucleotidyltransferase [Candidatus Nanohaloarchaea archaeon]
MKAVIPVAKKKEDIFPFSETKPTGLMPLMGTPIVTHTIHALQELGVEDIYLVTNYMENEFEEEFGEYTNVNIVHQEELSGTATALSCCDFIGEDFIVVNGDVIVSQDDLENLMDKHDQVESRVTMLATNENKPEKFGVLSITNDRVVSIQEKPEEAENPLINTGIYIFSPEIFEIIEEIGSTDLTDAVESLVDEDGARFELVEDYWIDIGSPRKLWRADRIKREYDIQETDIDDSAEVHDQVEIDGKAVVEDEAVLKPGTVLEGEVYIGAGATVGPNTVVRNASIGPGSQVEADTVGSCLVFEDTILDAATVVEDAVLGEEVDVKPGTVIRESFIGPRSFIEMNNSIYGVQFVPDARTDLSEISK